MALRGNLKDFTLPDVFQLIAASKKTGVLRITGRDEAEGSVWFRDGDVFFAQSNWHHEKIGDRLVAAQKITPSALARALETRTAEPAGRRIGQILVDEGYITQGVLEAFVQEQIQDTVFDLMRWDDGEFDFEILPEVVDEDIGLTVSIENIIMEGSRRLEEWARIKKKVPSMDIVFRMATAPGEGTYEISLKPVEWNLLLLIDGTRTVSELARATGRTDFEVARIVYGLFSAGLLEVTPEDEVRRLVAEREERALRRAAIQQQPAAQPAEPAAVAEPAEQAFITPSWPVSEPAVPEGLPAGSPSPQPSVPVEVPEFLSGAPITPGPEDMAVFEEMVGALFETPVPVEAAEPEPGPSVEEAPFAPEPEVESVAAEELIAPPEGLAEELAEAAPLQAPAAVAEVAEFTEVAEVVEIATPEVPEEVTEVAEFVPPEVPEGAAEAAEVAEFTEVAEVVEIAPPEVPEEVAEVAEFVPPEVPEEATEAPEVPAALETDLGAAYEEPVVRSGEVLVESELGESVFVEPSQPFDAYVEPAVQPWEPLVSFEEPVTELYEPVAELYEPMTVEPEPELEAPSWEQVTAEPMSVIEELGFVESEEAAETAEPGAAVVEELAEEAVLPAEESLGTVEYEGLETEILAELGIGAPVAEVVVEEEQAQVWEEESVEAPEFVEAAELVEAPEFVEAAELVEAPEPVQRYEPIAETGMDVGLAGVISDEINALTGAQRPRPATVVSNLDLDTSKIRRDLAIDRDTLLKIIDGIRNL